jgi:catechol 2,3-dioxygenase-like lactoylglutathione lyase family enzyme
MPELRRLAIVAESPTRLSAFYETTFDLEKIGEQDGAVFLSDGDFNLALIPQREDLGRGLSYLGFQMARVESIRKRLAYADQGNLADIQPVADFDIDHMMRDPDGNRIGLCRRAFDVSFSKRPVPIRHIALYTPDPQRLSRFYCGVLGMKEIDRTDRSSVFVSDGYFNLALLYQRTEEKVGLNHFGFHVESNEEMRNRAEKAGVLRGARRPERIPFAEYRVHDPEGNGIDISEKGWKV